MVEEDWKGCRLEQRVLEEAALQPGVSWSLLESPGISRHSPAENGNEEAERQEVDCHCLVVFVGTDGRVWKRRSSS